MTLPYRVLVLAAFDWNDPAFFQTEFLRLASLHKKITLIFPDDTSPWQLYVHDWCRKHPDQFKPDAFPKDVFRYGAQEDVERDWRMFWTGDPDEVWRIESSKGCKGRPNKPIYPHLWDAALAMNMTCITFRAPYRKKKPWNDNYMVPAKVIRKRKV